MTGTAAVLFWVIIAAILLLLEGATAQLVSIWFAVGAIVAIIPALLGTPLWFQLLIFLIFSILFLFWIRPIIRERISVKKQPTNADMVLGQTGIVLETIDNIKGTGRVSAMGLTWTARTAQEEIVYPETEVLIHRIEGVKLIVTPVTK